jgi:AcrR family transcriptional regulator
MSVHDRTLAFNRQRSPLLDVVAEVLVLNPSASLAEVALAAGIGRTTLHKHYPKRDDLIRAVGHRALDLWEEAVDKVGEDDDAERSLRDLVDAMLPIGPQLAFLWRTTAFDHDAEIHERWAAAEKRSRAVLLRAQESGLIAAEVPSWWLLPAFDSLIYSAMESMRTGHLAPRFAADLVLRTLLRGIGASRPS